MNAILILLVLLIPILLMFGLGWIVKQVLKVLFDPHKKNRHTASTDKQVEYILFSKCRYYKELDYDKQKEFVSRVITYMSQKGFSTRKGLTLTDEMRVLISASAIQLTMGLDNFIMEHFNKIIIYPEKYLSKVTGKYHKGEVNLAGIIAFSWKDFIEGNFDDDDNINLGLHEMAHALRFSGFKGEKDEFFAAYFNKWRSIAKSEFEKINAKGAKSIFRKYAGSNHDEFLSVCIEHFFETPGEFKNELPELYKHTCILLNQDPTRAGMGIGIRKELLATCETKNFSLPVLIARSGNSDAPVLFSFFSSLLLLLFIFSYFNEGPGPSLIFFLFLIPVAGAYVSYSTRLLNIYNKECIIVHWPGFLFSKKHLPYDQVLSAAFHPGDNSFLLLYLWNGSPAEMEFTVHYEDELEKVKSIFDENKVLVREYKAIRPARGTY
jgi:MtfA peptidase